MCFRKGGAPIVWIRGVGLSDQGRGFGRRGRRTAGGGGSHSWTEGTETEEEELRLGRHVPDCDEECCGYVCIIKGM